METLLKKLEILPNYKELLKSSCKNNGIKMSFLISMAFSKAKSIHRKLQITYEKGFGKTKTRWLENELRLFHFCLLTVSCLQETKISDFNQSHWQILVEAFPHKLKQILEYEGAHFIATKNKLTQKWESEEDCLLTSIVKEAIQEPKWNEIATDLFIQSEHKYFRNGKQCRQRWLNHLDGGIRREKWSEEQDRILIKSVLDYGKKWSFIMKCFKNQRTEHMIKNRYLSLTLKCKKNYPFLDEEDKFLLKIAEEMNLQCHSHHCYFTDSGIQTRLRPKERVLSPADQIQSQESMENYQIQIHEPHPKNQQTLNLKPMDKSQAIDVSQNRDFLQKIEPNVTCFSPSSPISLSPVSAFVPCNNNFFQNLGCFQWCFGSFQNAFGIMSQK